MLTPLEDIPDRFAGDPQAGLKEISKYLRAGTTATTTRAPEVEGLWRTEIRVLGTGKYTVEYREPTPVLAGTREYDSLKQARIQEWLHELTNVVRMFMGQPVVDFYQRHRDTTIREALGAARSTPETGAPGGQCNHCLGVSRHQSWCPTDPKPAPIARTKEQPVDAFVARVLARRGTGTPTV